MNYVRNSSCDQRQGLRSSRVFRDSPFRVEASHARPWNEPSVGVHHHDIGLAGRPGISLPRIFPASSPRGTTGSILSYIVEQHRQRIRAACSQLLIDLRRLAPTAVASSRSHDFNTMSFASRLVRSHFSRFPRSPCLFCNCTSKPPASKPASRGPGWVFQPIRRRGLEGPSSYRNRLISIACLYVACPVLIHGHPPSTSSDRHSANP